MKRGKPPSLFTPHYSPSTFDISFLYEKLKELGCIDDNEAEQEGVDDVIVWPVIQTPDLFTTQAEFEVEEQQESKRVSLSVNGKSKQSNKKQKETRLPDPPIPRRPKNPFYYYCRTERHKVIQQHGQMAQEESNKILSAQWNVPGFDKKRNTTYSICSL